MKIDIERFKQSLPETYKKALPYKDYSGLAPVANLVRNLGMETVSPMFYAANDKELLERVYLAFMEEHFKKHVKNYKGLSTQINTVVTGKSVAHQILNLKANNQGDEKQVLLFLAYSSVLKYIAGAKDMGLGFNDVPPAVECSTLANVYAKINTGKKHGDYLFNEALKEGYLHLQHILINFINLKSK